MKLKPVTPRLPGKVARNTLMLVFSAALAATSGASLADDTEVFFGGDNPPNLLLVLDASGSMRQRDGGTQSRLERMKDAIEIVLDNLTGVNVGLMQFTTSFGNGGGVQLRQPIGNIASNAQVLKDTLRDIRAQGGTPTAAALYESKLYFQGAAPLRGVTPDGSARYTSPIAHECQSNNIVLLTDGRPTRDNNAVSAISAALGSCVNTEYGDGGKCGLEVARHLQNTDQNPSIPDVNNVTTHAIGFNFTTQWLKDIAAQGGGTFNTASSADDLVAVFSDIIDNIRSQDNSFAPPAITVDQFSPLTNREDIYLTLFQPSSRPRWAGNLKRYAFNGSPPQLRDANGVPAIDPATGGLRPTARSFWSGNVDGDQIRLGGAAEQLNLIGRKVLTYNGVSDSLMAPSNQVHENNLLISATDLGLPNNARRNAVLQWARGVDVLDSDGDGVTTDARNEIADPLHSKPTIVNYGGTATTPDSVVFFGTNQGYLHAIDTASGREIFSFIPRDLLSKLKISYDNSPSDPKPYGMDGDITVWTKDTNRDRMIDASAGEHVYLYTGMRRGGDNYYALDITDKNNPKHLWTIRGGSGDFANLAQSWSKPVLSNVSINGTITPVLIFAGGYDTAQDTKTSRSADAKGSSVYIVNANTGDLLWEASSSPLSELSIPDMVYSIPSDPKVLDLNGDGLVDQIYVGDMGGQIFRFDVDALAATPSALATGGVIANLAGNDASSNRRFFYAPDISLINDNGNRFLSVSIGSGNRANPLGTAINDRFYMIRQPVSSLSSTGYGLFDSLVYRPITESDLFDTTSNIIQQGSNTQQATARQQLKDAAGWLLHLESAGEKNLSPSVTVNNQVVFSTYLPLVPATNCGAAVGSGRVYALNILDGTPVYDDGSGNYTKETRYVNLDKPGIPPQPVPFFGDGTSLLAGTQELPDLDFGDLVQRVYWTEQQEF